MAANDGSNQKKGPQFSIQAILNAVYTKAANLLGAAFYGVAGSNYIAIRVKPTGAATSGYVMTSAAGGGGGITRVSADILQSVNLKVSAIQLANGKISAIFLPNQLAGSGIYVRLGLNAKVSNIMSLNQKVSAIFSNSFATTGVPRNNVLRVSAQFNAAGSAALIAASAGYTRKITDIMISTYASGRIGIKAGGFKITPFAGFAKHGGMSHPFGIRPIAVAGSAIKLSASFGSGQVVVHYYV